MTGCPSCDFELSDPSLRFCSSCGHDLKPKFAEDEFDGLVGKVVDGRYKVLGRIGMGGMGLVYRVEHVRMGKVAAMKVLRRDLVDDAQAARRFIREVEVVSKLEHPNIVQTFDFGEWRGLLYLVMELVRGEDLAAVVKREGPLSLSRALPLFVQVCEALEEAHHLGVIHRDLKPDNIVVFRRREGEHIKVLDFGLAKLRERPGVADVTGAGSLVGTPYYMAPEQVRSEAVDERTDLYALGATIYRVVTGTPAFTGDSPMAILTRHITDPVEPPSMRRPGLPLALDHLVLKSMAKDPANRFANAKEMREALSTLLNDRIAANEHSQPLPSWVDRPHTAAKVGTESSSPGHSSIPTAVTQVEVPPSSQAQSDDSDLVSRLRRQDVDLFERGLQWKRRILLVVAPLAVVAFLFGAWRLFNGPPEQAESTEVEPNDSAKTANLASTSAPMFGQIGSAKPDGTPDFDYFRIPVGRGDRALSATINGIADLNVVIELFDSNGALVTKADGGEQGSGEALGPVRIAPSESFLRVRPVWHEGEGLSVPSSQTPYALSVKVGVPGADSEIEPNENQQQACTLKIDQSITAHLGSASDVDFYFVEANPGVRVVIELEPDEGLTAALVSSQPRQKNPAAADMLSETITAPADGRVAFSVKDGPHKKNDRIDRSLTYKLVARIAP